MYEQVAKSQKNYGNYITFCSQRNGNPKYFIGPHWPIALIAIVFSLALITWLIIYLRQILGNILIAVIAITTLVYLYAYIQIFISDPGLAQPMTQDNTSFRHRYCPICRVLQINGTKHCGECNVCILNYDHHCPWTGKCIGGKNMNSFYFFLGMVFILLAVCFSALVFTSTNSNKNVMTHPKF